MDLRFSNAQPTARERQAVDAELGAPATAWEGSLERDPLDARVARLGREARERRHELLPALAALQAEIGWISEGGLMYVCRRLSVPPADAYGVASFYAMLSTTEQPARVLHVCDDVGCAPFGADTLLSRLETEIGPPGSVVGDATWVRSPCLGQCDRAPACFGQVAGHNDVVLTGATFEATAAFMNGDLDSSAGAPLPQQGQAGLRLLARIGMADPLDLAAYRTLGGYEALAKALEIGPDQVLAEVTSANLRGRGGAAFPAGAKWEAVARSADESRYVICNADESEPGTFKDRVIMEEDPFAVIESMTIAGVAIGAQKGYLYIRGEYPVATDRLQRALAVARQNSLLGPNLMGSETGFEIELRRGQGAYICGEETALMNSIEGFRGEPRNKPPFPTVSGLFGKPTVVNNVETLVNVLPIVREGGKAFAETGTADSSGTKLFCLSGAVERRGVYEVEFGATLGDLIEMAGGAIGQIQAVLLGGAAGSFVGPDRLEIPLTFAGAREAGVSLGSGVIMVFGEGTNLAPVVRRIAQFFRDESCGQCVPCRVGTVRVEEALSRTLAGSGKADIGLIDEIDRAMKDASICGLGHTAASAVRSAIRLGLVGGAS